MLNVATGEKVIDYLTDERRIVARNPDVAAHLDAVKDVQNIAEELIYQGSFYKEMKDAWKLGMPLASIPWEAFYALSHLHPEWFTTVEGKKDFIKWLNRHPAYRYYPKDKNIR